MQFSEEEATRLYHLLDQEQQRVKQFINENNLHCLTAPYIIVNKYRKDLKNYMKILRDNIGE
jgi:hypothetical protein